MLLKEVVSPMGGGRTCSGAATKLTVCDTRRLCDLDAEYMAALIMAPINNKATTIPITMPIVADESLDVALELGAAVQRSISGSTSKSSG